MMKPSALQSIALVSAGLIVSRHACRPALVAIAGMAGVYWWRKTAAQVLPVADSADDSKVVVELLPDLPEIEGLSEEEVSEPLPYLPPINRGKELPDEVDLGE